MKPPGKLRWYLSESPHQVIVRYLCELPQDEVAEHVFWPSHNGYGFNLEEATYPAAANITWEPQE